MSRFWPILLLAVTLGAAFLGRRNSFSELHVDAVSAPPRFSTHSESLDLPKPSFEPDPAFDHEVEDAEEEPETDDTCMLSVRWLLNNQNPDGSWGGNPTMLEGTLLTRPGMTGLALLPFLGAGYSHLSKDTYDGKCMGDAVRNAIKWLMADQREDGTFRSSRGELDHVLAAFALSEAYGLTGSNLFKEEAQKAIDALTPIQAPDGSWGTGTATVWAAGAIKSAEISGLSFPRTAKDGIRRYYDVRFAPDPPEMVTRILMDGAKDHPAVLSTVDRITAAPPNSEWPSLHSLYFQTLALFRFDGPSGETWKAWNESFRTALLSRQLPSGTWPGRTRSETVVNTSLGALCVEVYFRYPTHFVVK